MADDDLEHIPSIVPTRDTDPAISRGAARGRKTAAKGRTAAAPASGAGILARFFIFIALAAAAGACAWAWQLQQQLQQSQEILADYKGRIADLEDRLSDTDEGLSNNSATMAVKIKELTAKADENFTEIDKLWASAWRKNKAKIAALETKTANHDKQLKSATSSVNAVESQLKATGNDIAKLKAVAGDLDQLVSGTQARQAEVERVADDLNRLNLELAKLAKRVEGNEEWVDSINAFRRQMSAAMTDLRADIQVLQATP
jgi:chromosome segregation ATPase